MSRQQAFIQRGASGQFFLRNIGRRPVVLNNVAVESGKRMLLPTDCLVEVGGLRLIFMPNRQSAPPAPRQSGPLTPATLMSLEPEPQEPQPAQPEPPNADAEGMKEEVSVVKGDEFLAVGEPPPLETAV